MGWFAFLATISGMVTAGAMASGPDSPAQRDCQAKGGTPVGESCYCEDSKTFVGPKQKCLVQLEADFERLNLVPKPNRCEPESPKAKAPVWTPQAKAKLCDNPVEVVCDPAFNPYLDGHYKAWNAVDEAVQKAVNSRRVVEFARARSGGKSDQCTGLPADDYKLCVRMVNDDVTRQLFTAERKKKADAAFRQAKDATLKYLWDRYMKLLARQSTPAELENMIRMIRAVESAKLAFGPSRSSSGKAYEYNAKATRILDGYGNWRTTISLEGLVTAVDQLPAEVLVSIFEHELGHAGDSSPVYSARARKNFHYFRANDEYAGNPFAAEIQCLKRGDSVLARSANPRCLEALADKYAKSNPKFAQECRDNAALLRLNADDTAVFSMLPKNEKGCGESQVPEAFADWLATEAHVMSRAKQWSGSGAFSLALKDTLARGAFFCMNHYDEVQRNLLRSNNNDGHPLAKDRLNRILFAHPELKKALGCPASSVYVVTDFRVPNPGDGASYCGPALDLLKRRVK